jgi:hypothetical protein
MTRSRSLLTIVPRLFYFGVQEVAGFYSILCYIPFVFGRFIEPEYSPALTAFARYHSLLFILALAGLTPGLLSGLTGPLARRAGRVYLAVHVLWGGALLLYPITTLSDSWPSLAAAAMFFLSLVWAAAVDVLECARCIDWKDANVLDGPESTGLEAVLGTWAFVSLCFLGVALFKVTANPLATSFAGGATIVGQTLAVHFAFAMMAFTVLLLFCGIAAGTRRRGGVQFLLLAAAGIAVIASVVVRIVFAAISFTGPAAWFMALASSLAIVSYLCALKLRLASGSRPLSGVGMAFSSVAAGLLDSKRSGIAAVLVAGIGAILSGLYLAPMDYNRLIEQLLTPVIWLLAFAGFYTFLERPRIHVHFGILYGMPILGLVTFALWSVWSPADSREVMTRYREADSSFRLVSDLLTPSAEAATDDNGFYAFLERHTNIPGTREIVPVDVQLAERRSQRQTSVRPHIFIVVVDSLRKDYLSPYNARVTFTPSVASFAANSVVLKNAFANYGATGLSEPSLWIGGLMLHRQYVKPFYPMNSLEKLIEEEGYRSLISRDTVLDVILKPNPEAVNIDEGVPNRDYRLCRSLSQLSSRLAMEPRKDQPVFAYTQPQDLHVSIINREGRSIPKGESYPGFDGAYASRLRVMDACFGQFISHLQAQGIYENSVIVLTSDHGDSLGEGGRYGHAYTLFPEIIQVPLIVHLPKALQKQLQWDVNQIAFLSDITPSLYYLLGHRPIVPRAVLGKPLFTESLEEQKPYARGHHLLASSYGPVWGVLRDNGRYLYIADGVNYTDYFFDLRSDPKGETNMVSDPIRRESRTLIEEGIGQLNEFYRFNTQD